MIATAVAAGVGGAVSIRNAGIAESNQMKAAAVKEGDAARQREIDRKRTLLRALSDQSARAGASGVTMEGSVAAAARTDIRDASNDMMVDRSNTRGKQNALRSGAKNARRQANLGAAVSLFDTGSKVASQF
jgi:hypothetical protein